MIEFTCSQCGKKVKVPDDASGKRGKCRQCGAILLVPPAETVSIDASESSPGTPARPIVPATPGTAPTLPAASNPKLRRHDLWLALLLVVGLIAAPFAPKFPLWSGIALLVLCAASLVPGVQASSRRLLRVNLAEKWPNGIRLTMCSLIGLVLALAGWTSAGYQAEQSRIAAQQAAAEAEQRRIIEANAQVVAVVREAEEAWKDGDSALAQKKLEGASRTPNATELDPVRKLRNRLANANKVDALLAEAREAVKAGDIDAGRKKVQTALAVRGADGLGQERVVSLSVQPEIQTNKRVIVGGKTNLPPDTSLIISLEDAVTGESCGQTKTRVLSNGTYKSELLGPLSGLKDGQYVAGVITPIARVQPEAVRQVIGDNAQNLKGPLVEKGTFGITVNAEKKFSVGGEDAAATQTARLKNEFEQYGDLTKQIKELFSGLEKTKRRGLLDDQNNLVNLQAWGMFARQFRSDLEDLQNRVDKVDSLQARLYLAGALGDVGSMFHDAAFKKENEYRQSKSAYADSLRELKAFIRQRESTIPKRNGDSTAKRDANEFRELKEVTYTIVNSHVVPGIKRRLDIRLNKKVSEETLRALALKLKSQDSRNYERTFIGYYLPDMKVGAGAWATTHFNPDLEVHILGLTAEQEEALRERPDDPSREVIGSWIDDRMYLGNRITIFRQDGKLFMENTFTDGSSGKKEIVAKPPTSEKKFEDKEGNSLGEFYLIDSQGNLQFRDQDGLISTAKRIGG